WFGDRFPPRGKAVVLIRRRLVPAGWVRNQVRRAAGRAGLAVRAEFLPVPNLDQVEAFLIRDRDPTEWRLGRSPRLPVSLKQPREHVFFLAPADGATGFSEAARLLNRATGDHDFSVERFHLRRRGALVLVLAGADDARRLVRVATNPTTAGLVRKNRSITERLRDRPDLAPAARGLIPSPLGESGNGIVEAFVEEFRPGRLAWLLYRDPECRVRIEDDLFRFSHGFQSSTRRESRLEGRLLDDLIEGYLEPIRVRLGAEPGIARLLDLAGTRLRRLLEGRARSLCASHGDFGVGNALAAADGTITAIIDWDQYQDQDLPGIDWCDYRLKVEHFRLSVFDGLRQLVDDAVRTGFLAPRQKGFGEEDFGLRRADMRTIPCLAVLREVSRAARFPGELQSSVSHYAALLDLVNRFMPEAPE
ncbi:MAG TPA: phosphotransferase, partial [Gemmatimonadales bacterium]